jgi:phage terminase small subunit
MAKLIEFEGFLSEQGKEYYFWIKTHVSQIGIEEIDNIEIAMLANEYDLYFSNMEFCQKHGYSFVTGSNNGYSQIRPEFTVMKTAYQNILKHSPKFGMNPGDRNKIFNIKKPVESRSKGFDLE